MVLNTDKNAKRDLPELHQRVLSVIPKGQQNAITISYIIDKLGLNQQRERRKITSVITDLIFEYGFAIGSSSDENTKGVFLIETEEDLALACRTLNSRAMKVLKRQKQIVKNYSDLAYAEPLL